MAFQNYPVESMLLAECCFLICLVIILDTQNATIMHYCNSNERVRASLLEVLIFPLGISMMYGAKTRHARLVDWDQSLQNVPDDSPPPGMHDNRRSWTKMDAVKSLCH